MQDLREVLATDHVDPIDEQVGGDGLVAGYAPVAAPLDQPRRPPVQPRRVAGEERPIGERREGDAGVLAGRQDPLKSIP